MLPGIFLIIFGLLLSAWGIYRVKNDFKNNKKSNNIIGLILSGQGSGIGQLFSGILAVIVGIVVIFMNR